MVSVTNVEPTASESSASSSPKTCAPCRRRCCRSATAAGRWSSPAAPEQLGRFELYCAKIAEKEQDERKNKTCGGAVFSPVFPGVLAAESDDHALRRSRGGWQCPSSPRLNACAATAT